MTGNIVQSGERSYYITDGCKIPTLLFRITWRITASF